MDLSIKKNKRVVLISLLLLFVLSKAFGQDDIKGNVSRYMKPPELSSLEKFGNIPVSYYTGVPSISFPIYNINDQDISIPISINYHASGIKVDEEASRVGLGWNLNSGGVIYRQINGKDDFYNDSGFKSYLDNSIPSFSEDAPTKFYFEGTSISTARKGTIEVGSYVAGGSRDRDFQPDNFSFSLPNLSGKFIIDREGNVIQEKKGNIKIKLLISDVGNQISWIITDGNGIQYYFNEAEVVYPAESPTYISAWYLTKIVSPKGPVVNFEYVINKVNMAENYSNFYEQIQQVSYKISGVANPSCPDLDQLYRLPWNSFDNKLLSTISFNNGKVLFEYSNRDDIQGEKKLDRIRLVNANNKVINEFSFAYDYFNANYSSTVPYYCKDNQYTRLRLKLSSLTKGLNDKKEITSFQYNENKLPAKYSLSRDHWGYSNGEILNQSLIPAFSGYLYSLIGEGIVTSYSGANREPNKDYTQGYILNKINYPTGGYTLFEYENHDYDAKKSGNYDNDFSKISTDLNYYRSGEGNQVKRIEFEIPATDAIPSTGRVQVEIIAQVLKDTGDPLNSQYKTGYYEIRNLNNVNVLIDKVNLCDSREYTSQGTSPVVTLSKPYSLSPGKYYLEVYLDKTADWIRNLTVQTQWIEYPLTKIEKQKTRTAGGLRVKKISDFDNVLGTQNIRNFEYGYINTNNEYMSYGKRLSGVRYDDYVNTMTLAATGESYPLTNNTCRHFIRSASSNTELFSGEGVVVGYDTVIVKFNSSNELGKSVFIYKNIPDQIINFDNYMHPAGMHNIVDPMNGLLIEKLDYSYDKNASVFNLKEGIKYDYSIGFSNRVFGMFVRSLDYGCTCREGESQFFFYPSLTSTWIKLNKVTESNYLNNNVLVKTSENEYEAVPLNYNVKKETISTSNSTIQQINEYYYSTDFVQYNLDKKSIIAKDFNIINPPIEIINKIKKSNGYFVKGAQYNDFSILNNSKILLEKQYQLQSEKTIIESSFSPANLLNSMDNRYCEINEFKYDNINYKLKRVKQNQLINNSYKWGYNEQLPIAECKNAEENEFYFESFEEDAAASIVKFHTGAKCNYGRSFTVSYTKPNSRIYAIGWFELEGNIWKYKEEAYTGTKTFLATAYIDDIRIFPSDAQMTTYTYEPLVGMTSSTDAKGQTSYYEYDDFQRLKWIKDQEGNIIKTMDYHYQNQ